jgi:hypothetical protein
VGREVTRTRSHDDLPSEPLTVNSIHRDVPSQKEPTPGASPFDQ